MAAPVNASCRLCHDKHVDLGFNPIASQRNRSSFVNRVHVVGDSSYRWSAPASLSVRAVLPKSPAQQAQRQSFTRNTELGLVDNKLESTFEHKLWVLFGSSATLGMIGKAVLAAHSSADGAGICVGAIAGYILADLGTGVYHWAIDNYGDAETPLIGYLIDAAQGHHRRPWTITKRALSNNLHATACPVGFAVLPLLFFPTNPTIGAFLGTLLGLSIASQQFHAWAHSKKSELPPLVAFLQERGVLLSRKNHSFHHTAIYGMNYCIVSGYWNPFLTKSKFFLRLERAIHSRWAVAPRSWAGTAPEWTQDGTYFADGSELDQ